MHRSQVLGYFLLALLAGIFIGSFLTNTIGFTIGLIIVGTLIFIVAGYRRTFEKTKRAGQYRVIGMVIGTALICMGLGVFRVGYADYSNSALTTFADDALVKGQTPVVTVQGYVDDEPDTSGSSSTLIVRATKLILPDQTLAIDERTLVTTTLYPQYRFGDMVTITGTIARPKNFSSDFDYVEYLKNKEIRTTFSYPKITATTNVSLSWSEKLKITVYRPLFAIKDRFESALDRSLPQPVSAYLAGVLLGSRQNIPADLTQAFNNTSTTHILAISGYNITIIADTLLLVFVTFMRRRKAFWLSVGVIVLFTIMTGAGASVVRAAIMGLLLLAANGYGRWYDPKNSILCAAAIMAWFDPLSLRFDVSMQLSFLAVLGLMYIEPVLKHWSIRWPNWGELKDGLLVTTSAQLAVAPLLAYEFHSFSLVSLPANILVLPFMPLTMFLAFVTGVAGWIWVPLGKIIGLAAWALATYQLAVIQLFSRLSFSAVTVMFDWPIMAALYAAIIGGLVFYYYHHRTVETSSEK